MASDDELKRVFQDLAKEGRLQLVIAVLREEFRLFRSDLDAHLIGALLSNAETQAEAIALQGAMKGLDKGIMKLRELGGLPLPADA